ncbi:unnamed protein product [Trichogramma brassicae]|uniref:Uncharacterized protein n=1 Tax=Trichogramma brassicae TaxID=86971 RepID=A0A6H5IUJ5_9HYME|nr:unnamed protein product [Trichogramma brassicae]
MRQFTQPIRTCPSFSAVAARSSGSATTASCVPAYAFHRDFTGSRLDTGTPSRASSAMVTSSLVTHSSRSLISIMDVCSKALAVAAVPSTLPSSSPRAGAFSTPFFSCSTRAPAALRLMLFTLLPNVCCNAGSLLSFFKISA